MRPAVPLQVVDGDGLPQYPIPRGERLESHSFFLFHYDRWLNSDLFLLGDWDVQGVALALWCRAQDQDPVGTLPESPRLISALLNMSSDTWAGFLRHDPNPLHRWSRCLVGDEVRLMHPVVTEVALEALGARIKGADRKSADRERQRIKRLRQDVEKLVGERMAAQDMFIAQLDQCLARNYPGGNRTTPRILEALEELGVQNLSR